MIFQTAAAALTVLKKELKDLLRDPRTMVVSILLPLILFPLIFTIAGGSMAENIPAIQTDPEEAGRAILAIILPFIITIFSSACPLPFAADLSAGEKERKSLEPLLSSAAPRTAIIAGKLAAAGAAGFLSLTAFTAGLTISYLLNPGIIGDGGLIFRLSPGDILLISAAAGSAVFLFAGLELLLGFLAKSVREAQLLGMPVLIISGLIVYTAQYADPSSLLFSCLPLVNLAILIQTTITGVLTFSTVVTVFACSFLYLLLLITGGTLLLRREATLLEQ